MARKMTTHLKYIRLTVSGTTVRKIEVNSGVRKLKGYVGNVVFLVIGLAMCGHASAATFFFHTDHLGTPHLLTDKDRQIVWKGEYDPFGKVTESVALVEQNLRFPGQYFDGETGHHYNNYRTYDPYTGRYLESDPVGLNGGLSTYLYAKGNPQIFTDFYGLYAACKRLLNGIETTIRYRDDLQVLWKIPVLVPVVTSLGVGPDLDPPKNPKYPIGYWWRKLPPVGAESNWNLIQLVYTRYLLDIYEISTVYQKIHSFCEETKIDECGNKTVYRTNKKYKVIAREIEKHVSSEQYGRWRESVVGKGTFGF